MPAATKVRREGFVTGREEGKSIYVLGNEIRVKVSSRDTGGAFTIFESWIEPLKGPPLHCHPGQDETWYVAEGKFRFEVDGQDVYASEGDTVFAPRGSRHTFQCIGSGAGHLVTTVVPGGVDEFFEDLETAAPRGTMPDPAKLAPILAKHHQELLGPPLAAREAAHAASD